MISLSLLYSKISPPAYFYFDPHITIFFYSSYHNYLISSLFFLIFPSESIKVIKIILKNNANHLNSYVDFNNIIFNFNFYSDYLFLAIRRFFTFLIKVTILGDFHTIQTINNLGSSEGNP